MSGIRAKDTKPEMMVRRGLHCLGFRFRLHDRKLAGSPDMVFPKYRAVLFIHGCFWHGHDCSLFRLPGTRTEFWREKIAANQARDTFAQTALMSYGWRVGTLWECATRRKTGRPDAENLEMIANWLKGDGSRIELRGQA